MAEFFTLSCPSCGAKLQIGNDVDKFACGYCGNEHVVKRSGGIISLAPVVEQLKDVKIGVDKTASELAVRRLRQEIDELKSKRNAIKGEGCLAMIFSGGGLLSLGLAGFILALMVDAWVTDLDNFFFGFIAVFAVFGVVIAGAIDITSGKDASEQRNAVQKIISEKQVELEKHEKIVSGE